jgi:hypothetical protein
MTQNWKDNIACATHCPVCENKLGAKEPRIFSTFDHRPICMACKKQEEQRKDYPEVSQALIGQCMLDSELTYGVDPEAFCYHHFYPFSCG